MFEAVKKIYAQDLFSESVTAKERLGTIRVLEDGRKFVYAKMGATGGVAGNLYQAAAPTVTNHTNIAVAAAAALGAKRVSVTLGATAAAANLYADGFLNVNDAAGEGHLYKIKGHAAIGSGGTGWINLYDPIRKALTTSSEVSLVRCPVDAVIIHPSPPTAPLAGVCTFDVTANYYAWLQVSGICSILTDGTLDYADSICASNGTDGSVEKYVPATTTGLGPIGYVLNINASTEYSTVMLQIPGF